MFVFQATVDCNNSFVQGLSGPLQRRKGGLKYKPNWPYIIFGWSHRNHIRCNFNFHFKKHVKKINKLIIIVLFSVECYNYIQFWDWQRLWNWLWNLLLVHPSTQLYWNYQTSTGPQLGRSGLGPLVHQHTKGKFKFHVFTKIKHLNTLYFFVNIFPPNTHTHTRTQTMLNML